MIYAGQENSAKFVLAAKIKERILYRLYHNYIKNCSVPESVLNLGLLLISIYF